MSWYEQCLEMNCLTQWDNKLTQKKYCISILWLINGIHSFANIPKRNIYNTAFWCDIVVSSIITDITSHDCQMTLNGFMIHLNNVSVYNSRWFQTCIKTTRTIWLSHPVYSPDLTPNDCFFFGYVKEKLINHNFTIRKEFKSRIIIIFNEIGKDIIMTVFMSWIKRVKWVIKYRMFHGAVSISRESMTKISWNQKLLFKSAYVLSICDDASSELVHPVKKHRFQYHFRNLA
jgi:hypothetical protein